MKKEITLQNRYNPQNNSFHYLSIVLALAVIINHSYNLYYGVTNGKVDIVTKIIKFETLGSIALYSFFIISGFFIIDSIKRSKNTLHYLKKRMIKIYPSLLLCLFLCAIIIPPLVTKIPMLTYIKQPKLYIDFILSNALLWKNSVYRILDVFKDNPYPFAINGSLWSLKHTFFMYIAIIPIYHLLIKKKEQKNLFDYVLFFITLFCIMCSLGYHSNIIEKLSNKFQDIGVMNELKNLIVLSYYFCIGIFYNLNAKKIKFSPRNLIFATLLLIISIRTPLFSIALMFSLPYFILYLGTIKNNLPILDISYQMYLFAFPIQQLIIHYLHSNISFILYTLLSISITMIVAIVVYWICEYPFQRKSKLNDKWNTNKKVKEQINLEKLATTSH